MSMSPSDQAPIPTICTHASCSHIGLLDGHLPVLFVREFIELSQALLPVFSCLNENTVLKHTYSFLSNVAVSLGNCIDTVYNLVFFLHTETSK